MSPTLPCVLVGAMLDTQTNLAIFDETELSVNVVITLPALESIEVNVSVPVVFEANATTLVPLLLNAVGTVT